MIEDYEEFTEAEKTVLNRYVTHLSSNIFVLRNMPEVVKGALFSRYSRSGLGLRALLLKEFISNNSESLLQDIEDQSIAIQKAKEFYDRILDGYGDDSIGELGGAHIAIENVSMIAAKAIEDARIGGSPLEKSTRYVYFDQKRKGEYLFYREPVLMKSALRDTYLKTCNHLFDVYSSLIPILTEMMEKKAPRHPDVSKGAYTAALRAKVLDCLRGLLPASTLTNMGLYGNGRFFEALLQRLSCENLTELQECGRKSFEELSKVIPSYIRRGDPAHRHCRAYQDFREKMAGNIRELALRYAPARVDQAGARLIDYDPDAARKVARAMLFSSSHASLMDLKKFSQEDLEKILDAGASARENRRHKSPRALEHANFTFEIVADFGIYRDLQRHRILTQERQWLTCNHGYFIPEELLGNEMERPYREAMDRARKAYDLLAKEFPEESQYVVPMAYNVRWYFHSNLRSLQWLCELRSSPQGHPGYRAVAQSMAHQVFEAIPEFKRFFKFVDFEGYHLGRLDQEIRNDAKRK